MKRKELKLWSPEWIGRWRQLLQTEVIVRADLEFTLHGVEFDAWLICMESVGRIHYVRLNRFLGSSTNIRKTSLLTHEGDLSTYLEDLEAYWLRSSRAYPANWMEPVGHRAVVQPFISASLHELPSSHALLLPFYGMLLESVGNGRKIVAERQKWELFYSRFRAFMAKQEMTILEQTLGYVTHNLK